MVFGLAYYLDVPFLPIGTSPNGLSSPPRWGRFFGPLADSN
jgi:hypothetical protein